MIIKVLEWKFCNLFNESKDKVFPSKKKKIWDYVHIMRVWSTRLQFKSVNEGQMYKV